MSRLIRDFREPLGIRGGRYLVRVYADPRTDRRWEAWLEFRDASTRDVILTGRETTQPDLLALRHWAAGLRPAYLDGALARARLRFGIPIPQR